MFCWVAPVFPHSSALFNCSLLDPKRSCFFFSSFIFGLSSQFNFTTCLLSNKFSSTFTVNTVRPDQFNSLFLVQSFHQSHASERKQKKNAERKQKRIDANHNIRKEYMQGSDQSVHKWNTKTDMRLLSLFCHDKQSRYLNAHVHKRQHSAQSRHLFLPHWSPRTSFHLFAWSRGRRRRVWSLLLNSTTLLDSDWAVAAWRGHAAPVCWIHQGVQSINSARVEVFGHSSSPFSQSVRDQNWRGSLIGFPMNSFPKSKLCLRWIPNSSPPASRSRNWRDAGRRHFEAAVHRPFASAAVLSEERVNEQPDLPWVR